MRSTPLTLAALLALALSPALRAAPGASDYAIGVANVRGQAGAKDYQAAAKAFYAGARKGHAGAQYMLAKMYLKGIGVRKNKKKGAGWLKRSAKQMHPKATMLLAKLRAYAKRGKDDMPMPVEPGSETAHKMPKADEAGSGSDHMMSSKASMMAGEKRMASDKMMTGDKVMTGDDAGDDAWADDDADEGGYAGSKSSSYAGSKSSY